MKLFFKTSNPTKLKEDILELIEDEQLQTWKIYEHEDEKYLKHAKQWGEKGVVKLSINDDKKHLSVEILRFKGVDEDVKDFEGYYLGRFCEIIFVNLPNRYSSIERG